MAGNATRRREEVEPRAVWTEERDDPFTDLASAACNIAAESLGVRVFGVIALENEVLRGASSEFQRLPDHLRDRTVRDIADAVTHAADTRPPRCPAGHAAERIAMMSAGTRLSCGRSSADNLPASARNRLASCACAAHAVS